MSKTANEKLKRSMYKIPAIKRRLIAVRKKESTIYIFFFKAGSSGGHDERSPRG